MRLSRKYLYIALTLVLFISFTVSLLLSPPRSWNDSEPPGWPNKYPEESLQGMVAAANRLSYETWLSPPFNSYVLAYASAAYWDAYRAESEEDSIFGLPSSGAPSSDAGVTAFSRVFYEMVPVPAVKQFVDRYDSGNVRGVEAANTAIKYADRDKILETPKTYREILQESGVYNLNKKQVWLPVYNTGPITEPNWGSMNPIFLDVLECKAPPPPSYTEDSLTTEAENMVNANRVAMGADGSNYPLLTSLYAAWFPRPSIMHSNLTLALDNVFSNMVDDSDLSSLEADRAVLQYVITMNDARIVAYRDKYLYRVPAIQSFTNFMTIDFPHHPSYPSEASALAGALDVVVKDNSIEAKPRLEVAGNMFSQPWNRVLRSTQDLKKEVTALAYLEGLNYTFDLKAGEELGLCVAGQVSKTMKEKGI